MKFSGEISTVIVAGMSLLTSAASMADTTSILKTGEISHLNVFNDAYGGGFTQTGTGFASASITATRVDDSADQYFGAGTFSADVIGLFSASTQSFGIATSSGFVSLIDGAGYGFNATGSVSDAAVNSTFAFARSGSNGLTESSVNADNADGLDYMITYELIGLDGQKTYVLFFEDWLATNGDRDFNDLIVEVRFAEISSIPTPTAGLGGLLGLAIFGLVRHYRRARA